MLSEFLEHKGDGLHSLLKTLGLKCLNPDTPNTKVQGRAGWQHDSRFFFFFKFQEQVNLELTLPLKENFGGKEGNEMADRDLQESHQKRSYKCLVVSELPWDSLFTMRSYLTQHTVHSN